MCEYAPSCKYLNGDMPETGFICKKNTNADGIRLRDAYVKTMFLLCNALACNIAKKLLNNDGNWFPTFILYNSRLSNYTISQHSSIDNSII